MLKVGKSFGIDRDNQERTYIKYPRVSVEPFEYIVEQLENDHFAVYEVNDSNQAYAVEEIQARRKLSASAAIINGFREVRGISGLPGLLRSADNPYSNVAEITGTKGEARTLLRENLGLQSVRIAALPTQYGFEIYVADLGAQPTGSFKPWIGYGIIKAIKDNRNIDTIILATTGNQGIANSYIGQKISQITGRKVHVVIFTPFGTPTNKIAAMDGYGATIFNGHTYNNYDDAVVAAKAMAASEEYQGRSYFVDHAGLDALTSYSALGDTILEHYVSITGSLDNTAIISPVGAGGLSGGIDLAVKYRSPGTLFLGAQSVLTRHAYESFVKGEIVKYVYRDQAAIRATGIDTKVGKIAFDVLRKAIDGMFLVDEAYIDAAIRLYYRSGIKAEPAAVLPYLAFNQSRRILQSRGVNKVLLISTGSNISDQELDRIRASSSVDQAKRRLLPLETREEKRLFDHPACTFSESRWVDAVIARDYDMFEVRDPRFLLHSAYGDHELVVEGENSVLLARKLFGAQSVIIVAEPDRIFYQGQRVTIRGMLGTYTDEGSVILHRYFGDYLDGPKTYNLDTLVAAVQEEYDHAESSSSAVDVRYTAAYLNKRDIAVVKPGFFGEYSAADVGERIIFLQQDKDRIVNIVLATGNTMKEFLHELAAYPGIDPTRVRIYHLDEYRGLARDHPASFAYFLTEHFLSRIAIPAGNIYFVADAVKFDPFRNPRIPHVVSRYLLNPFYSWFVLPFFLNQYMKTLRQNGGADIIMLGMGMNGHLAFNERFGRMTGFVVYRIIDLFLSMRPVKVSQQTIIANKEDYPGIVNVPFAASMGMRAILRSGAEIYFLVNGTRKAAVLKEVMEGPVTDRTPASRLRKTPTVHYIFDAQAWHDETSSPIIDPQVILQRMIDLNRKVV
jgi:glucosamine-6-phosphate deaminase